MIRAVTASTRMGMFTSTLARATRRWRDGGSRRIKASRNKLTQDLRAFQLRSEFFRKSGQEALEHAVRAAL